MRADVPGGNRLADIHGRNGYFSIIDRIDEAMKGFNA